MKEFEKYYSEKTGMSKKKKRIILIIILLVLAVIIVLRIGSSMKKKAEAAKKQALLSQKAALPVEVQKIVLEPFTEMIETHGDIQGVESVNLFSDYSGKIIKVFVEEGQSVRKGQTLATMNRDVVVQRFEDFPIKALISGIVGKIYLKAGETVTSSLPIMSVVNIQSVKCIAKIVEKELGRIKKKAHALVRVDSYPGITFKGEVSEISPVLDQLSRSSEVTILIPNYKYAKTQLLPGMYAKVDIILGEIPKTLLVPYSSILSDDDKTYIFVYRENRAKKIYVKIGGIKHYGEDTSKDKVVVEGDVREGDFVIYMGHQFLNDNDKIRFFYEGKKYGPEGEEKEQDKQGK